MRNRKAIYMIGFSALMGLIAMVIAGVFIGNEGRRTAMSARTRMGSIRCGKSRMRS